MALFGGGNEIEKAIELCKQFCTASKVDPNSCMRQNPDGSTSFGLVYPVRNSIQELTVWFTVFPSKIEGVPHKIIVWAYVAAVENIPAQVREEFFRRLLVVSAEEIDTCAIGIDAKDYVVVKSDRQLNGLDYNELTDMIRITFGVAARLRLEICPRYKIQAIEEFPPGTPEQAKQQKTGSSVNSCDPNIVFSRIQRSIMDAIDGCSTMFESGNHLECYKSYYQKAQELLNIIKTNKVSSPVFDTIKENVEKAIYEETLLPDNQKKCLLFRNAFDEILKMKP